MLDTLLETLLEGCQSELERSVLRQLAARGVPLPSAVQYTCLASDGTPVASADLYYAERQQAVLVDGPAHAEDYVRAGDIDRRTRLKHAGYGVQIIRYDQIEIGLVELAQRLGVTLKS